MDAGRDKSCDFQTNSCVEVALMLQTDVTSARSSWESGMISMEQERHLVSDCPSWHAAEQQEEQREDGCGRDFYRHFRRGSGDFELVKVFLLKLLIRKSNVGDVVFPLLVLRHAAPRRVKLWRNYQKVFCFFLVIRCLFLIDLLCCYRRLNKKVSLVSLIRTQNTQRWSLGTFWPRTSLNIFRVLPLFVLNVSEGFNLCLNLSCDIYLYLYWQVRVLFAGMPKKRKEKKKPLFIRPVWTVCFCCFFLALHVVLLLPSNCAGIHLNRAYLFISLDLLVSFNCTQPSHETSLKLPDELQNVN